MTNHYKFVTKSFGFLLLVLILAAFGSTTDDELYLNYKAAIENESTFQFYLVATIKDKNTGKIREYCTQGNLLKGALHREYDLGYSEEETLKVYDIALRNKERYLELSKPKALQNIGVGDYTMEDLAELEAKVDFDSLAQKIRKDKQWKMWLPDYTEQILYAHALFNRGILTGENNCVGGTLIYVDRNNSEF